jgi:hypothetical protein
VVLCDSRTADHSCGAASTQGNLTCFAAASLGGHDFCSEKCDPNQPPADANWICLVPGARLQRCHPIEARKAATPECPTGFSCIATDLRTDSGICMPPCGPGDECKAPLVSCDASSTEDTCGMVGNGTAMTCFAASALHGEDFCTEACDPSAAPPDPRFTCTSSGALLQICQPSAPAGDPLACPPGLSCYRRNLLGDSGVCISMQVCNENSDCPGTTHCTGSILRNLLNDSLVSMLIDTDHLNCVVDGCLTLNTPCPAGEGCLAKPYFTGSPADFCVPRCDSKLHCPPNYSCAVEASGSGSPSLCFPGAPGVRCVDDKGCAGGECQDTGAGFKVCAVDCTSNAFCALFNPKNDSFVCVEGGNHRHCVTPTVFSAPNCTPGGTDCPTDQQCFRYPPFDSFAGHDGECRFTCDAAGQCASFGGLPHVCLLGGTGGCYPAVFGIPCVSECIADLQCLDVPAEDSSVSSGSRICTLPCSNDLECDQDPWTNHVGYCQSAYCRHGRAKGAACARNAQCSSRLCNADGTCG